MNKKLRAMLALVLSTVSFGSTLTGCFGGGKNSSSVEQATFKQGTYRTTTSVMPSNWNEFTYSDANDTQIMSYISSSFFEYDYEFDAAKGGKFNPDGTINTEAIVEGSFITTYSAATAIVDVTDTVDAKWGYTAEQKEEGGYAWQITLRNDLKWDDGSTIDAGDFVYSMREILNPDFMNSRANTYYDTLRVKRSRAYFFKNQTEMYDTVSSKGYTSIQEAIDAGADVFVDPWQLFSGLETFVDSEGNPMPKWIPADGTIYADPSSWEGGADVAEEEGLTGAWVVATYGAAYLEPGCAYESAVGIREINLDTNVTAEDVGIFQNSDLTFTICLDKSYQFVKEDGSLSYQAAYYMSSLPLVKQDLYEECIQDPQPGTTLYTSNYNSSLATTASWGPYKLESFQTDKSYKLVRNEYWYGYNMEENKNQYNITAIECECVKESNTNWIMFLAGEVDDAGLDTDHIADYMNSKYVRWAPGSGTFGMQLFSDLSVLKNSDNNNSILAIEEFRQGFSLALNRADVVETIWPGSSLACFGIMNDLYYSDVENGETYRGTKQAKEGLLRAYGFTQDPATGLWSDGADINGATTDDAYDALTGYNPILAKEKMQAAYDKLVADAEFYGYDDTKGITIVYGSSSDTAKQRERMAYLQGVLDAVCAGTDLEGKITLEFDASAGNKWSDAFRTGATQIGFGYGFQGNALNPFDMVGAFVDPDDSLNYHTYWNTHAEDITITLPAGDYAHAGETITMSAANWFYCLNGLAAEKNAVVQYNFDAGKAPAAARLTILAALEELVITRAYSVMLIQDYTGSLLSPKFSYLCDTYNMFMGFGGMRYITVNYTDAEWADYVAANGGDLTNEYKKTE